MTPFPIPLTVNKMRSPINAAWDTLHELGMLNLLKETIEQDPQDPERWLITFESLPGVTPQSRLHVELFPGPVAAVLDRQNVGRSVMNRIMDKLMDRLDRPPRASQSSGQRPSGGSPPPSPELNRRGPPADDMSRNERPRMRR